MSARDGTCMESIVSRRDHMRKDGGAKDSTHMMCYYTHVCIIMIHTYMHAYIHAYVI